MKDADPIDQALGQRIGELRAMYGLTLESVAAAAREVGLPWSRGTVWALEAYGSRRRGAGTRRLNVAEFLLLPRIFETAIAASGVEPRSPLTVAAFIPRGQYVDMGGVRLPTRVLRRALGERA